MQFNSPCLHALSVCIQLVSEEYVWWLYGVCHPVEGWHQLRADDCKANQDSSQLEQCICGPGRCWAVAVNRGLGWGVVLVVFSDFLQELSSAHGCGVFPFCRLSMILWVPLHASSCWTWRFTTPRASTSRLRSCTTVGSCCSAC